MKTNDPIADVRAIIGKLDTFCRQVVSDGAKLAYSRKHEVLDVAHLLASALCSDNSELVARLERAGLDVVAAGRQLDRAMSAVGADNSLPPAFSGRLIDVLRDAWLMVSLKGEKDLVDINTLIVAIASNAPVFAELCERVPALRRLSLDTFFVNADGAAKGAGKPERSAGSLGSALSRFTVDLNARATQGGIDPVVGRDTEIAQIVEVLLRRRQNNPILTGEAGVGKTAIVEGLAQRICSGLVPNSLRNVVIHSLDMGLLKAGAGVRGEIEARLKELIADIATADHPIVLFIDEAHTLVGGSTQGDHNDIANLVKPELARGSLRTIAATTLAEYKRYFEKDDALSRRFQVVKVAEPSEEETCRILQGLVPALQAHHRVHILQKAIEESVRLSSRYIPGRQLPDKAISVLDTACARAVSARTGPGVSLVSLTQRASLLRNRLASVAQEVDSSEASVEDLERARKALEETEVALACVQAKESLPPTTGVCSRVTADDVASVIADWTGIPSQQMLADQCERGLALEADLLKRIVGQPRAIQSISRRMQAYAAGLEDPGCPIGVFLLVGPSGVGKTETAHALAEAFFGGDQDITVVNMSEYQESHTVSKLKGSPPGYVGYGQGGVLTEAIRRRPYGLLLLDEIEKAHPDVINLFLQVFDKGFMEDAEGVKVDFKNTLIILTSNAASDRIEMLGDKLPQGSDENDSFEQGLHDELAQYFPAAFLGRVLVVPFMPLCADDIRQIVGFKLQLVQMRFNATYGQQLGFGEALVSLIAERCQNNSVGARLIDQFIAENVLGRLSRYILETMAEKMNIANVIIDACNGQVVMSHDEPQ